MNNELQKLLKQHKSNFSLLPDGQKVVCTLNGHELPVNLEAVNTFINGKKYSRLKAAAEAKLALKKYEPFLVQSRNFEDKLYCALTCQLLGKSLDAVRQHMRGKRFHRAKEQYQNDQLELMEEPSLDDAKPDAMEVEAGAASADGVDKGGAPAAGDADDDGLWVPEEYMELETEAAAEAARAPDEDPDAGAAAHTAAAAEAPEAASAATAAHGVGPSSRERRQKKAKPKHKAKRARSA